MNETSAIRGLLSSDKVVFDYVFNYYYSSLCAFSLRYIRDKEVVEDLVQEFFVSIWIKGSELRIHTSLKTYLFTGVKNRCLDYLKHQKVVDRFNSFSMFSAEQGVNSTDRYMAEAELRLILNRSLDKLPPRCAEVFKLSRIQGLSNLEISEQLEISKRTVELQISNALKVLRIEFSEYFSVASFASLTWLMFL